MGLTVCIGYVCLQCAEMRTNDSGRELQRMETVWEKGGYGGNGETLRANCLGAQGHERQQKGREEGVEEKKNLWRRDLAGVGSLGQMGDDLDIPEVLECSLAWKVAADSYGCGWPRCSGLSCLQGGCWRPCHRRVGV